MSSCPGQRSHPRTHKGGRCPRAPRRRRPPGPPQGESQARGESALSTPSHQTPTEPADRPPHRQWLSAGRGARVLQGQRMTLRNPETVTRFSSLCPVLLIFPQVKAQQENTVFGGAQSKSAYRLWATSSSGTRLRQRTAWAFAGTALVSVRMGRFPCPT